MLKAKAVLCPGLRMKFFNEATGEKDEWFFSGAVSYTHLTLPTNREV